MKNPPINLAARETHAVSAAVPSFATLQMRGFNARTFIGSAGLHFLVIPLMAWVAPMIEPDEQVRIVRAGTIQLHFPASALLTSSSPKTKLALARAGSAAIEALRPTVGSRLRLELPPLPPRNLTELTFLQPNLDVPPPKLADIRLPALMQWTPEKPKPKEFVMPGARAERQPDLRTEPLVRIEAPSDLPAVTDLSMQPAPFSSAAHLPVQISAARPVREYRAPPQRDTQPSASLETIIGDSANLITLSPAPDRVLDKIRIPAGSQLAAIHASQPPAGNSGSGSGVGGPGNRSDAGRTGPPPAASQGTDGKSAGSPGKGVAEPPVFTGNSVPIRIEHPVNGTFDIVIVQSSVPEEFSGAGVLSGSPVYLVYVYVGTSRRWILQYCVPNEQAISKREGIAVQLGNPAPVKAPFPRITVAPPNIGRDNKIVVHGFLSESGEFEKLRVLSGELAANDAMLLPLLQRWVLRPAIRDGHPVRIEVMLLISG